MLSLRLNRILIPTLALCVFALAPTSVLAQDTAGLVKVELLYVLYRGGREPVVLPQILTRSLVLDALGKI